jgi:hypothetical protein
VSSQEEKRGKIKKQPDDHHYEVSKHFRNADVSAVPVFPCPALVAEGGRMPATRWPYTLCR